MSGFGVEKILAHVDAADFVGRASEVDRLLSLASTDDGGIALLATPGAGTSELLRQVYDRLFCSSGVIPFYFEFRLADATAEEAAERFAREFLVQALAFRRHNPALLSTSPDLRTLSILGAQQDTFWLDHEISILEEGNGDRGTSALERRLAAPLRALASGVRTFVMIDSLHVATQLSSGEVLIDWLTRFGERAPLPVILSGARRHLYGTSLPVMALDTLPFEDAGVLIERVAERNAVEINEQVRDLIAVQLNGSPAAIIPFLEGVRGDSLTSFESVEKAYTDATFGGLLSRRLTRSMSPAFASQDAEAAFIRLFHQMAERRIPDFPAASGKSRSAIDTVDHDWLHVNEIVNLSSGTVTIDHANTLLLDVMDGRHRLEIERAPRALVVGEATAANVKRSTALMASYYRKRSALDLRSLMELFGGRRVPAALLDHALFKAEFKGADDEALAEALREDTRLLTLPRIVYSARTETFARLDPLGDENSIVAFGFDPERKAEVVWLAAQIDSKLEAKRVLAEYWCDRLDDVARRAGFTDWRLWLVSPEGFTADALAMLAERNAFGTSMKQVALLTAFLSGNSGRPSPDQARVYEFVIPMGDDTEIIAARAVEDIAKRHGISPKAINQIKTAVVEACINAVEHGMSPDRKIYQTFTIEPDKITVTIANRGLRLADREARPDEGRRGWGLKLMQGLMDDVRIEETDDGTKVTMTKFITDDRDLRLVSSER